MRLTFIALCLFLLGISNAQAQSADFKGVPFGATEAAFLAAHPTFRCVQSQTTKGDRHCIVTQELCALMNCNESQLGELTYAGEKVEAVSVRFVGDKMAGVLINFSPASYGAISAGLRVKFGKPASVNKTTFTTVGGAKTPNETTVWKTSSISIRAIRYEGNLTQGTVHMMTPELEAAEKILDEMDGKTRASNM